MPLAHHFVKTELHGEKILPEIAPEAQAALEAYDWPGNVRELENAIKHALTFRQKGSPLTKAVLPAKITDFKAEPAPIGQSSDGNASLKSFLKTKEKEYIEQILNSTGGDKEKAAEALKVNLSTLYRKLSD